MNRFITALLLILITSVNLYAKTKTKKYKDGSIYVGEWKYNIPYGEGVLTLKDGTTIFGNWQKGKLQGYGSYLQCQSITTIILWLNVLYASIINIYNIYNK